MTCPRGLQNDPFPGLCRQYIDQNYDGYCDLSQSVVQSTTPAIPSASSSRPDLLLVVCLLAPPLIYTFTSKHKIFWNLVLLFSFIVTAVTSVFYVFGQNSPLIYRQHLILGCLMVSVSFCHLLWHWRYFFALIKKVIKA